FKNPIRPAELANHIRCSLLQLLRRQVCDEGVMGSETAAAGLTAPPLVSRRPSTDIARYSRAAADRCSGSRKAAWTRQWCLPRASCRSPRGLSPGALKLP